MDVSGSMRATDVEPNRIVAAQAAARAFVAEQPSARASASCRSPARRRSCRRRRTTARTSSRAIDRFQLQRGTAIGSGILVSLKTIFPDAEFDLRSSNPRGPARRARRSIRRRPPDKPAVQAGAARLLHVGAAIILLTDGQTTTGPDPIEAARMAADRGVRVYTVGIGTADGEMIGFEGWSMRVRLDEEALKTIANMTRGEYFYAGTATDLKKVYQTLNTRIFFEQKETEITALFSAAAAAAGAPGRAAVAALVQPDPVADRGYARGARYSSMSSRWSRSVRNS